MSGALPAVPVDTDGLAIVVIGRNEGERLRHCLRSVAGQARVVYVDSGSTDGSISTAYAAGAEVVALDMSVPFTAARARNAGRATIGPEVELIQFVDGDCQVQPGWLACARAALVADPGLAAVFGRRREVQPDLSVYNWLCDVEWAVPPGPVNQFGGDVMLRAAALDEVGGYPDEMIAGEEPDLSMRLGTRGWRIACLPAEMTLHDAAMTRFTQWWRRAERSGHAYAELDARHPGVWRRRVRAALFWGAVIPASALGFLILALVARQPWLAAVGGLVALLPVAQLVRVGWREARVREAWEAFIWTLFLQLDKPPHALGILRYYRARWFGRRTRLIEYKGAGT